MSKCKNVLWLSLAVIVLIQSILVDCLPEPEPKRGSFTGALAGGLAGLAVGHLLNHRKSSDVNHYHYSNPPSYSIQSAPVMFQQPYVPMYPQQQAVVPVATMPALYPQQQIQQPVIAPAYPPQQPQSVGPIIQQPIYQQQRPVAPVYQQPQQSIAGAAVYPGNMSHPVTSIVYATNQTHPVSYINAAINRTQNPFNTVPVSVSYGNNSIPANPIVPAAVPLVPMAPSTIPVAPLLPAQQQFVPMVQKQQPIGTIPMMPMIPAVAQPPNVYVLSKHHGHYHGNANTMFNFSYVLAILMPICAYFLL